ncbi:major facilitator superfamily domain-containing protein [Aspergillus aurantiobrunneus]
MATAESANTTPDPEASKTQISNQPYTIFTPRGTLFIVLIVGFATIAVPLTATVYFPLLATLEVQFNALSQAINMTLTIYIIFQALSPAVFGPLSDATGRRPVYLITLAIYVLANLGMALNKHNYAVLLLFRAFQSLGASAACAISYGIVADVCVPSERGKMMGWVSMALNLGTYILGLVHCRVLLSLLVGMFLPETARNLVGNGSDRSKFAVWQQSWWDILGRQRKKSRDQGVGSWLSRDVLPQLNLRMFATPFRIIFFPDAFLCLWMHGSFYTVDYILAATVSDIFTNTYDFNTLFVGLSYLPRGIGIVTGGYCNGRMMDHNYKATARKLNRAINRVSGDDLQSFPIELARSRGIYYLLAISTATLVAYGWTVHHERHFSIPLVLQYIQGLWGTCFYTVYNTLLVDIFPQNPSTAAATASIVRCAMAATGVSITRPLLDAAGLGWYFTSLGVWSAVCGAVAVWCLRSSGMGWRQRRYGCS